jgi:hypothetical protein
MPSCLQAAETVPLEVVMAQGLHIHPARSKSSTAENRLTHVEAEQALPAPQETPQPPQFDGS